MLSGLSARAQFSTRYDSIASPDAYTGNFIRDSNGNCIFLSHVGPHYLVAADTAGHPVFTTKLRYPDLSLSVGLIETTDSNYVTLCNVATTGNVIQYSKFDTTGNLLWKKCLTSFAYNNVSPSAICAANDGGGIIVGGGCNSNNMTTRFDVNGNIVWQYQYRDTIVSLGNVVDAIPDGSGFIVVDREFGAGDYFPALIRLDSAGGISWTHRYYTPGYCHPSRLLRMSDGGYLLGGMYSAANVTYHSFLARFDSAGTLLWSTIYDSGSDNRLCSVAELSDGRIVFTETGGNNLDQVLVDAAGNFLWGRILDNSYLAQACVSDAGNGNFYTAGASKIHVGNLVYNRLWLDKQSADSAVFCNSVALSYNVLPFTLTPQTAHVYPVSLNFVLTAGSVIDSAMVLTETSLSCPPIVTSLPEISLADAGIFPNPVTADGPLMSREYIESGSVALYDVTGQLLLTKTLSGTTVLFDNLAEFANGVYFVKVISGEEEFAAKLLLCR